SPTGTSDPDPRPDLGALPEAAYDVGDWNGFLAAMTGVNSAFLDKTGAWMRRLTDATAPLPNRSFGMTYASGGAKVSAPFGDALDTYWVIYEAFDAAGQQSVDTRLAQVQRGVGVVSDESFTPPGLATGRLGYTFSYRPGETHILYYVGDDRKLHRYDVQARADAPDAVFSGEGATHPTIEMDRYPGWLQTTWDGERIAWVAPYASPTELHHLDLALDRHTRYDAPATLAQVNDIRLCRGDANVCAIATNDGSKAFWFVEPNLVTAFTFDIPGTQGHADFGEELLYTVDADGSHVTWSKSTIGDPPAVDGGPWTGSPEPLAVGEAPDHVIIDGDYHTNMTWDQRGAGGDEVFCVDNDASDPYKNTADRWEVHEGEIWATRVTFGIYGSAETGVSGVLLWNGSTTAGVFTGNLEVAPSVTEMAAGTWFWDGQRLFVWMGDGGSPEDRVRIVNASLLGEAIGYIRQSDGLLTKLCYDYRNEANYNYFQSVFANWSIDGKVCVFASNMGVQGGRTDLLWVEVPLTGDIPAT
ncbi:MAG: hypothetical protein ABMA64_39850, partial [Myxococcota bacterium]